MSWFEIWGERCTGPMLKSWYRLGHRDFKFANLFHADLSGARLSGADLSWSKLFDSDLSEADLSKSRLFGADLSHADLSEANLSWAKLEGANLDDNEYLIDLGIELDRAYRRVIFTGHTNGEPRIMAGCRYFTFAEARAHWGSPDYPYRERGDEYLALIDIAEKMMEAKS